MANKPLIYLASPYSAPTKTLRTRRFTSVCKKAAELMEAGNRVFCPIAHSHPIETIGLSEVKSGDWWLEQDFAILEKCNKMLIYCLPGWQESYGIKREIEYASLLGIPIEYIE